MSTLMTFVIYFNETCFQVFQNTFSLKNHSLLSCSLLPLSVGFLSVVLFFSDYFCDQLLMSGMVLIYQWEYISHYLHSCACVQDPLSNKELGQRTDTAFFLNTSCSG